MIIGIFIILVIIIIFGVIAGGESFGDTIRKGCGCITFIIIIGIILVIIFFS